MFLVQAKDGSRRVIKDGQSYRLEPGEFRVRGSGTPDRHADQLANVAAANVIHVGDLINYVTTKTGFKRWWNKEHPGKCMPCQKRQAILNYFSFKGPVWVAEEVAKYKETDESNNTSDTNPSSDN